FLDRTTKLQSFIIDIRKFFKKAWLEESEGQSSSTVISEESIENEKLTDNSNGLLPEDGANTAHIFDVKNFLETDIVLSSETRGTRPSLSLGYQTEIMILRMTLFWRPKKRRLCRSCVLFKPHVDRGFQGSFIVKEFTKYRDFHASITTHMTSKCHGESSLSANNFVQIMERQQLNVVKQIDSSVRNVIESNRQKLLPTIKTLLFCGTRGIDDEHGVFKNVLDYHIDAGDSILKNHLQTSGRDLKYTSQRTQNEIINICGDSPDISGVEQLSIAIRFVDKDVTGYYIVEEFLEFVPLESMEAKAISDKILLSLRHFGLNSSKMVRQGYDGCSVMAGEINSLQKLIQEKYPMANSFHCALHKLNLVVNDLNNIQEVRNTAVIETKILQTNTEIKTPCLANSQKNWSNLPNDLPESYYRRSVFLPYLDSLISSLNEKFSEENESAYLLFQLHPNDIRQLSNAQYTDTIRNILSKYGCYLENFRADATIWFAYWKDKPIKKIENLSFLDLIQHSSMFYPSVSLALTIALTLPATICTVEKSFGTPRRIKNWLRSTMGEKKPDGLCMMSVHCHLIDKLQEQYFVDALNRFALDKKRMQLLFTE
ncbi:hypothetical protein ILUMI_00925, partial [Ignelater luminosus]